VICSAIAIALGGCGRATVTVTDQGHAPQTAAEREAAGVVRAYDLAVRRNDATSVCRIVGGTELDAFRCRTRPLIPADRRSLLDSPSELRVDANGLPTGGVFLSGAASGSDIGLLFKVSRTRGAFRVTSVRLGRTL
jgi:hypothetical protein